MNKQIKECTQTLPGHSHGLHYRGTGVYQTTRQYTVEDDTYNQQYESTFSTAYTTCVGVNKAYS